MDIFKSIWRKRGRPGKETGAIAPKVIAHSITMTDRDYSPLTNGDDVAIKFWLPELMGTIIDECCRLQDITRSDLIRQTLFISLYGRYDWLGAVERRQSDEAEKGGYVTFYQGGIDTKRDMGKNIEDLKVWIPRKLKDDIQALADHASISLSEMVREIVISSMVGQSYLPSRNALLQMKVEVE